MFYYFTPAIEHDFMFNQMIPVFQNILSEIITDLLSAQDIVDTNNYPITDTNGIVIENFNFMNFYKYLAYEGLHNSQSYMNNINNNPIELRKHIKYNDYAKDSSQDCQ
ncbi:ERF4 family protein [Flavobacterium sediminilitoris]|uniref:ERF4 family protein n=1 Tax=Flavobacterium sediminilitoris TaxID=2024526 RepID=A0ABY4HM98_9FLAO|nr:MULTISPECIES: ERF4 family protein [Flavobacterium]UOX33695.1 ERF4 family protein [Flavobacterium sediminilitoris]